MSGHAKEGEPDRAPIDYKRALDAQEALVRLRQQEIVPDLLWLLEHPSTITFGTSGDSAHLLASAEDLEASGVAVHETRRGGDVTCHERGQLVGYPIVRLAEPPADRDIHLYLRRLEAALITSLSELGLPGRRIDGRTGVWLGDPPRKIIAMGVRCNSWVTSHGFAFNVENELAGFQHIVPCGIADAEVTSLAKELGAADLPSWDELANLVHRSIEIALGRTLDLLRAAEAFDLLSRSDPTREGA
jgi:lipoyl(octanoyl) transferase